MDKLPKYQIILIVVIIVIVIALGIYFYGYSAKPSTTVTVTNDTGGVTTATAADTQKATALAAELYNNLFTKILGFSIGTSLVASEGPFDDLASSNDVVFALTFADYNNTYNRSLVQDLNSNWVVLGTSAINASIQRAQRLGITV